MREDGVHAMYDYFARKRGGEIAVVRLLLVSTYFRLARLLTVLFPS